MVFVETSIFTRYLHNYLDDKEYQELQAYLLEQPDAGDIIKKSSGIRKLRWSSNNQGKRGGIRVIYYWHVADDQIYLLTLYAKNEATDLSDDEKKALKKLVENWK